MSARHKGEERYVPFARAFLHSIHSDGEEEKKHTAMLGVNATLLLSLKKGEH